MKIAYIVLCHRDPQQVDMLLNKLSSDDTDFFIHVDKKVTAFTVPQSEHVFVLPQDRRVDVRWASKSMVVATLNTIEYMFEVGKRYDYVFLVSGQDFPIKSNREIEEFLSRNHGRNFIEVLEHTDGMYTRYSKRNAIIYPGWMLHSSKVVKAIKKGYIYLSGGYNRTFSFFERLNTTGLTFEFGSQWWCLTYECLWWISDYITHHPEVMEFFDYALTPDECLFQTVFMASPYRHTQSSNLTYLEWDNNRNHPRVLRVSDYSRLLSCEKLFARKFDINIDCAIIEKLSENK